jgi:hypothetical protein
LKASSFFVQLSAVILLVSSLQSCKEDTLINSTVIPPVDNINTFAVEVDSILTVTVNDDSVLTGYNYYNSDIFKGIGVINADPFFGKTYAGAFFQIVPPTTSFTFAGTNPVIDSAILVLPYSGVIYGDSNATVNQQLNVYQIEDAFSRDSLYYSNQKLGVNRLKPMGSATMNIRKLLDSNTVWGVKVAPQLRIKLNSWVADSILANAGGTKFADYPTFLTWFKGIYVEPDTTASATGRAIPYFKLDGLDQNSRANIIFYYHNNTDDSLSTSFGFVASYCAHTNWIKRTFSNYPIANYFPASGKVSDSIFMIQNEPGAAGDITIRLDKVFTQLTKTVINKAELVITQIAPAAAEDTLFEAPVRLFPSGIDSLGAVYTIADRYPTSSNEPLNFIDGTRRVAYVNNQKVYQYIINIPRELQSAILKNRKFVHLRLNGTVSFPGAYRLKAGGNKHSNSKIKLNIIYTKIQ